MDDADDGLIVAVYADTGRAYVPAAQLGQMQQQLDASEKQAKRLFGQLVLAWSLAGVAVLGSIGLALLR